MDSSKWVNDYDKETILEYNKLVQKDLAIDITNNNYESCSAASYWLKRIIDKEILLDLFEEAQSHVD